MGWVGRFAKSSIGSKYFMSLSGLALSGFLLAHLSGNLLVFAGQDALNTYAAGLRKLPFGLLWVARIGLLVMFILHVYTGIRLSIANRAARPERYAYYNTYQASIASRTMIQTGLLVLAYIIFHLVHFTFVAIPGVQEGVDSMGRPDVYGMVINSFQNPIMAISYVVLMFVIGFHLSHGLKSSFQSLGLNHPKYNKIWECGGPVVAWALALAFSSIPLSILFGFVGK